MKKVTTDKLSPCQSSLIRGLRKAGLINDHTPIFTLIEGVEDKARKKAVEHFIRALELAHARTGKSKLHFGSRCPPL